MFVLSVLFGIFSVVLQMGSVKEVSANAGDETINPGSFIVNMGVTPQTGSNALKPYGMVYDLINNYNVPVKWVIKPSKTKDGTDFSYNSVNYKGGSFIIPAEFLSATVSNRITYWQSQGVIGVYSNSVVTLPVYTTLTNFPLVMIDSLSSNQDIIETYYSNAGIPSSAYSIGSPSGLTQCFDVWCNPHGDPTWSSHSYLYNFVTIQKSWIWAQCHSVSMMEYCKNGSQQLNFLTTKGLKCWGSNKCGSNPESHTKFSSSPYSYYYATEPVMQFIGNAHSASEGGSEQWYQPLSSGRWNTNSHRGITTGTGSSPNEGTVMVYGPAYNDPSNGWVMYQAGHDLSSTGSSSSDRIAAQRAYFNYILLAGKYKKVDVSASIPSSMKVGESTLATSIASSGTPPYSYQWSSALGGAFLNSSDSSTYYTAPAVAKDTVDIVQIKVTDQCGRINFYYQYVTISSSPLPVELLSYSAYKKDEVVQLVWSTASEINNDFFSIERSGNGKDWSLLGKIRGAGNSTNIKEYSILDNEPLQEVAYYRLSQTDYDGRTEGFRIIRLYPEQSTMQKSNFLHISPNPFSDSFSAELNSSGEEPAYMSLFSDQGDLILKRTYNLRSGTNTLYFSDNGLLKEGIYFVVIKTGNGKYLNSKIVKR